MNGDRRCGKPTKSGKPCRIKIGGSVFACSAHETEHDRALGEAWHDGYNTAREYFERFSDARVRTEVENALRTERARAESERNFRTNDGLGTLVKVDGPKVLTFRWTGSGPLNIGDRVMVPGNWFDPNSRVCTVIEIGSDYIGDIKNIIRKVD